MPLNQSDKDKIMKVARLAAGTNHDGEREKSINVVLKIILDRNNHSFLDVIEAYLGKVPVDRTPPASSASTNPNTGQQRPPQERYQGSSGSWNDHRSAHQQERERQKKEEDARANETYEDWKRKQQDAYNKAQDQKEKEDRARRAREANDPFRGGTPKFNYDFSLSVLRQANQEFSSFMVDNEDEHAILREKYIPLRAMVVVCYHAIQYNNFEPAKNFINDLSNRGRFQMMGLSNKQMNWLIRIFTESVQNLYMYDRPCISFLETEGVDVYVRFIRKAKQDEADRYKSRKPSADPGPRNPNTDKDPWED